MNFKELSLCVFGCEKKRKSLKDEKCFSTFHYPKHFQQNYTIISHIFELLNTSCFLINRLSFSFLDILCEFTKNCRLNKIKYPCRKKCRNFSSNKTFQLNFVHRHVYMIVVSYFSIYIVS